MSFSVQIQINPQGQITIPPEIQQQLGLIPGTEVHLEIVGDGFQVRKKPAQGRGTLLVEALRGKAIKLMNTHEIMQLTRGGA